MDGAERRVWLCARAASAETQAGVAAVLNRVHAESKRRMCVPHKRIVPSSGVTSE